MKVGAGGLQVHATHDEVANRQAQESRRTDYQQKPVSDSENAEALNRNALNKSVERPHDAAQSFDLPLRLRREKESGRGFAEDGHNSKEKRESGPGEQSDPPDEPAHTRGNNLDKYI